VNGIVFVVIIKLLSLVVPFTTVEVCKVDVIHPCYSGGISIFFCNFNSKIGTFAILSSRNDVEAFVGDQWLMIIIWLKRGWVYATFFDAELVNHVLAIMNPLVA